MTQHRGEPLPILPFKMSHRTGKSLPTHPASHLVYAYGAGPQHTLPTCMGQTLPKPCHSSSLYIWVRPSLHPVTHQAYTYIRADPYPHNHVFTDRADPTPALLHLSPIHGVMSNVVSYPREFMDSQLGSASANPACSIHSMAQHDHNIMVSKTSLMHGNRKIQIHHAAWRPKDPDHPTMHPRSHPQQITSPAVDMHGGVHVVQDNPAQDQITHAW